MSLPLSLEIVGTDRSHPEAGGGGADLIACRSVTNDSPILGRLFALLARNSFISLVGNFHNDSLTGMPIYYPCTCLQRPALPIGTAGGGGEIMVS